MKKRILISLCIVCLCLLIIPLVSAADPSFVFNDKSDIDLKISCTNSDYSLCANTTSCFITINYPDTTNLVNNGTMTHNGTFYNYTIKQGLIQNNRGEYPTTVFCNSLTESDLKAFTILIGSESSRISSYIIITIILIFIYFLLWFASYTEENLLAVFASMGLLVIGIYLHINGIGDIKNFVTDMFALINWAIGGIIFLNILVNEAVEQLNLSE